MMAFQFNAVLQFAADKAIGDMKRARAEFQSVKAGIVKANEGMQKMGGGVTAGAAALAPLTVGMGLSVKQAADFEQGMSNIQAVLLATKEDMAPLETVVKQLGASTAFSAREVADGAKFFAQAGFSIEDVMAGLPGALNAAAAGEIELATATDIIASSLGAFGLKAGEATRVADVLALTSSITNTDMVGLGEGLKYSAATARQAGMSIEETSSALGILANAGLKGSMGGTALQNALIQLTKPTKEVLELFGGQGGFNEAILDASGNLLPFEVIMANTSKIVNNSSNKLEAAGRAAEIFGLRGGKAFGAFAAQLDATTEVNDVMMQRFIKAGVNVEAEGIKIGSVIPTLVAMRLQMGGAAGAAQQMAEIRMSNLLGQVEELSGATEGLAIEFGGLMVGPLTEGSKVATDAISLLTLGFQSLNMTEKERLTLQNKLNDKNDIMFNQYGAMLPIAAEFAGGLKQGLVDVVGWIKTGITWVKGFFKEMTDGTGFTAGEIGNLVAKFVLVGAIVAPILGGLAAAMFVIPPILSAIGGLATFVGAVIGLAFSPVVLIIGGVSLALYGLMGGFEGIRDAVVTFGAGFMSTFGPILSVLLDDLAPTFEVVKGAALTLFETIFGKSNDAKNDFSSFGATVGTVAAFIVTALVPVVKVVAAIVTGIITLVDMIAGVGKGVLEWLGVGKGEIKLPDQAQLNKFKEQGLRLVVNPEQGTEPNMSAANPTGIGTGITDFQATNQSLADEGLRQQVLVQPPSATNIAEETVAATKLASGSDVTGGGQQPGPQTVKVVVEGRIRGNDLNLVQTRSQLEQSQLNGRSVSPLAKRRAVQNGQQFRE